MPCARIYSYADIILNKNKVLPKISSNAPPAPVWNDELCTPSHSKLEIKTRSAEPNNTGFVPASKFIEEKLNQEVLSFADNSHRAKLHEALKDFRKMMADHFPQISVWLIGSFAAGIDLKGSDLDFNLDFPDTGDKRMYVILEKFAKELEKLKKPRYRGDKHPEMEFEKIKVIFAKVPVIQMKHTATGVHIDVACNNDASKRNTQILVYYGQIDARFTLLCRAVKQWAKYTGVYDAKNGRLNSFSLCLLVVHFLQTRAKIFPNLQNVFPELNGEFRVESDDYGKRNLRDEMIAMGLEVGRDENVGVGVLFGAFLKYYSKFDFGNNWISIRQGKAIKKRRHVDGYSLDGMPESSRFICIEDPFICTPWNCAGSVRLRLTLKRMRYEFRLSYNRLVKERTIFTNGQKSEWRKRIDDYGVQRDVQIQEWISEYLLKAKQNYYRRDGPNPHYVEFLCPLFRGYRTGKFWNDIEMGPKIVEVEWPDPYNPYISVE